VGRLTIFAKGNLDLRDSLHSLKIDGKILWNGINEIVRDRFPGTVARVRHETCTRSDSLLDMPATAPPELAARELPLDHNPLSAQFSHALFESDADAIVLSIQPDLSTRLVRHRRDGYLLYPANSRNWSQDDRQWLRDAFDFLDPLDIDVSMSNFEKIVARIRGRSEAPILIYNVSSVVPGESIHCYQGLDEVLSTRIRRFNVALTALSERTGISVIDVDAVVARAGADRLKVDATHLNADGCRLVAAEVVRVLDDLGCFAVAAAH
jgi:hypothetical protein